MDSSNSSEEYSSLEEGSSLIEISSWEELSSLVMEMSSAIEESSLVAEVSSAVEEASSAVEEASSAVEEASSSESSGIFYPDLVLLRNAPFGWDARLSVVSLGGTTVRLTYDIRAKCKWDRVVDFADVAALQMALVDILVLARKSLRPRVPSREYDQHVLDIIDYINNL